MTTTIVYSNSADGYVESSNANYSTMKGGSNLGTNTNGVVTYWNQYKDGSNVYHGFQSFLDWTYTAPSAARVTASYIRVSSATNANTGVSRQLEMREHDWGGSITTADWQLNAGISDGDRYYAVPNAQNGGGLYMFSGDYLLNDRLQSGSSPLRVIAFGNRFFSATVPTVDEGSSFYTANESGTDRDPALLFTTVAESRLYGVLGAQAQLSDGSHVYLESQNQAGSSVQLKHRTTGGSVTTVATLPMGSASTDFAASYGSQQLALVVSSADHIYVIGRQGSAGNGLAAKAYVKGSGYTWTAATTLAQSLTSVIDALINNVAAAWHNTGTSGTIMVVASRTPGVQETGDAQYALLNCQSLLAGSGTLFRNSGNARGVVLSATGASNDFTSYANETGTALDVVALSSTRGVVESVATDQTLGENAVGTTYRYTLASGGTSISDTDGGTGGWGVKDASAKRRTIRLSDTVWCRLAVDSDAGYGLSVYFFQNVGDSSSFTTLGYYSLDGDLTTMASASTLSISQTWDALYDAAGSRLYIYYIDTANQQRLMRTSFDTNTYFPTFDETQVTASLGAASSTNYAIRVHRGATNGQQVLICAANRTSGGTHSTQYVTDTLNVAPNAPTLTPKSNFDATAAATFNWTFSDPNAGDTQSAYELEIVDTSDSSLDVDTGKVSSTSNSYNLTGGTLANSKSYQWRVRTWDAADLVGSWSSYSSFSTSAGGTVTITDPATDNPAGLNNDNYLVQWSVSGTTQAAYRVVVTRTDTSATLVNTGWVTSTATSYNVTSMLTGVEYSVAVTVRNALNVESGTGTRLITPDYDNVPVPTVMLTAFNDEGYVLVQVENPEPTGDDPAATANEIYRRRSGSDGTWTLLATIDPDSEYRDYSAGSGITYEYLVRATAP